VAVARFIAFAVALSAIDASAQTVGQQQDVIFAETSPLSGNAELMRRLLSPLATAQIRQTLARSGKVLNEQSIDPSQEKFVAYVPPQTPPHGYALLVFVPPWQSAKLPAGWADVLDHYGMIFVSASGSGNDANALGRREPLALIAEQNIVRHYAVDPQRIYVGGFSGGSRIAMRLALGYPDVFRGALLNAGSDPLGSDSPPLPPADLFHRFQESTRLVYVTGDQDTFILNLDRESLRSMQDWCVFDTAALVSPGAGHEAADSSALSRALDALLHPEPPDPDKLAACRSGIETELTAKLQQAQSLIASGRRDEARALLLEIDKRFGGLAAPRSVELETELSKSSE
jgi:hypothetical protein